MHAENVSLIRNLSTGYLSPQFHVVHDDWFETCYSSADQIPPQWEDLCIFDRLETSFDQFDKDGKRIPPPPLADEWLSPEDLDQKRPSNLRQGRILYQDVHVNNKEIKEDLSYNPPPQNPIAHKKLREPPDPHIEPIHQARETSWKRDLPLPPSPASVPLPQNSSGRYPTRSNRGVRNLMQPSFSGQSYDKPQAKYMGVVTAALCMSTPSFTTSIGMHLLDYQAVGTDPFAGTHEFYHPGILQSPYALTIMENPLLLLEDEIIAFQAKAFKAKASRDPDLPSLKESLTGPYAKEFWEAMDKEIDSIEKMGTWEVIDRSSLPKGARVVPGTWAQRIKRYPDGRLNKFKSRWCVRGDLERDSFTGVAYSPLVGWPTIRACLLLAASHGWASRQVDFSNAFCQSPQTRDVFVELKRSWFSTTVTIRSGLAQAMLSLKSMWDCLARIML